MNFVNPYIRLTRLDRPFGILMLYIFPCWWGITLASPHGFNLSLLLLFALGATFIRGAGCTFNDLMDRDIDRQVARTKTRPLASGEISPFHAFAFFCLQGMAGLMVLLYLPARCWPLSLVQLGFLVIYPLMKRITYWPQLILGFAINFGVIFGAVAAMPYEALNWPAVLSLYGVGIVWTVGYDTIYALQDKEDDLKIGVKSTAIRFGENVKGSLFALYGLMFALLAFVGYGAKGNVAYGCLIAASAFVTAIQLHRFDPNKSTDYSKMFQANAYLGGLIWVALLCLRLPQ